MPFDNFVVETAEVRFSVTADNVGDIWALAAGGAGALADGGSSGALAGSVSLNTVTGHTPARLLDSDVHMLPTEFDRQSTDTVLSLATGDTVRINSGPDAGDVYVYVGDVSKVTYDFTNAERPTEVTEGQRVLRLAGVGNSFTDDALFEYVGDDPLEDADGVLLDEQDYADEDLWELVTESTRLPLTPAAFASSPDWKLVTSDARVTASDDADIFTIAGALALGIAKGGTTGGANAVTAGIALAFNEIDTETSALVQASEITWADETRGSLTIEAKSTGSIKAFTVAGAVSVALAKQGSSFAIAAAASGSLNEILADTTAILRQSTVDAADDVSVIASNDSEIIAGAGAVAVSFAMAGSSTAAAAAFGTAFAVNNLGADGNANKVQAEVDASHVTAGGEITVDAEMLAGIFALGIGAAGGIANSSGGTAIGIAGAGSVGLNRIYNSTQALVHNGSTLTTEDGGAIDVLGLDDSWINATAGAVALAIAVSQKTAVAFALGFSLTINNIHNTTRATVEDSALDADGPITVDADSTAEIDSLGFGIGVAVALSGGGTAVGVGATGALSFNTIDNTVEATIHDTAAAGVSSVSSDGAVSVTASDDSEIDAVAIAASASISGSTSKAAISVSIGLALAHNTFEKDVTASIVGVSSVLTNGGDVIVNATDSGSIEVVSIAAALAVAVANNTAVGVAGGASESTNIIQAHVDAYVENSNLGSAANKVGKVDIDATSTSEIDATVGAVAVAAGVGQNAVGVAIGVAVARNFIGWNIDDSETADYETSTGLPQGSTLATNQKVKVTEGARNGDVYKYLGDNLTQPTETANSSQITNLTKNSSFVRVHDDYDGPGGTTGAIYKYIGENATNVNLATQDYLDTEKWELVSIDLRTQDFSDRSVWEHVNVEATSSRVSAYLDNTSVHAAGDLTADASADQDIEAVVFAATVAIAGGCRAGIAVSAGGVYTENRIETHIQSYIDGDGATGIHAASIGLNAEDTSTIEATAVAASIAAGFGGKVGVGFSIGIALAVNEIDNQVAAYIANANNQV